MEQKFNQLVSGSTVVSQPRAVLKVYAFDLTDAGRQAISNNSSQPFPSFRPPQRSWVQLLLG
jgi:hypothetical protein